MNVETVLNVEITVAQLVSVLSEKRYDMRMRYPAQYTERIRFMYNTESRWLHVIKRMFDQRHNCHQGCPTGIKTAGNPDITMRGLFVSIFMHINS